MIDSLSLMRREKGYDAAVKKYLEYLYGNEREDDPRQCELCRKNAIAGVGSETHPLCAGCAQTVQPHFKTMMMGVGGDDVWKGRKNEIRFDKLWPEIKQWEERQKKEMKGRDASDSSEDEVYENATSEEEEEQGQMEVLNIQCVARGCVNWSVPHRDPHSGRYCAEMCVANLCQKHEEHMTTYINGKKDLVFKMRKMRGSGKTAPARMARILMGHMNQGKIKIKGFAESKGKGRDKDNHVSLSDQLKLAMKKQKKEEKKSSKRHFGESCDTDSDRASEDEDDKISQIVRLVNGEHKTITDPLRLRQLGLTKQGHGQGNILKMRAIDNVHATKQHTYGTSAHCKAVAKEEGLLQLFQILGVDGHPGEDKTLQILAAASCGIPKRRGARARNNIRLATGMFEKAAYWLADSGVELPQMFLTQWERTREILEYEELRHSLVAEGKYSMAAIEATEDVKLGEGKMLEDAWKDKDDDAGRTYDQHEIRRLLSKKKKQVLKDHEDRGLRRGNNKRKFDNNRLGRKLDDNRNGNRNGNRYGKKSRSTDFKRTDTRSLKEVLEKKKNDHGEDSIKRRRTLYNEKFSVADKKLYTEGKRCLECFIHGETHKHEANTCFWKGNNWRKANPKFFVHKAQGDRKWFLKQ